MQLKAMLNDEDAVSPVIGVILMVAITVILAAVIASFVLGLGPGEAAPTASFDVEYDTNSGGDLGAISVSHSNGDTIEQSNLEVQFGSANTIGFDEGEDAENLPVDGTGTYINAGDGDVSSGDSITWAPGSAADVDADDEIDVAIVYNGDGTSSELDSSTVTIQNDV